MEFKSVQPEQISNIHAFLENTLVSDIMAHKRRNLGFRSLICVSQDDSIMHNENNIVSVPVFANSGGNRRFSFICTVDNIMEWLIVQDSFKENLHPTPQKGASLFLKSNWLKTIQSFVTSVDKEFTLKSPIRDVVNVLGQSHRSSIVNPKDTAATLLARFTSFPPRIQRVLAIDTTDSVIKIEHTPNSMMITESDLVRFLEEEMKKQRSHDLKAVFGLNISVANMLFARHVQTVNDNPFSSTLMTCPITSTAMNCFREMFMEQVSAVALVDSRDKLCGTLSIADLRHLNKSNLDLLEHASVGVFLEQVHPAGTSNQAEMVHKNAAGCITRALTVQTAVRHMMKQKIHRVWICDEDCRPQGVVSLSDVLTLFVPGAASLPIKQSFMERAVDVAKCTIDDIERGVKEM